MSRTLTIVTPENIEVTYQLAGSASRFTAVLIDLLIQLLLLIVTELLTAWLTGSLHGFARFLSGFVAAAGIIAGFSILLVYPIFFEMILGGRTPGKAVMGIRVIRDGGYPINLVSSAIRNVLRFVDFGILPVPGSGAIVLCGLPGLVCVFLSPQYKRLGDYAAGTIVVVDRAPADTRNREETGISPGVETYLPLVKNLDRLSLAEYRLLRRFAARRSQLELTVQAGLAERIARPVMDKLEMKSHITYQLQFADILSAIERRYAEEHGVL